MEKRCNDILPVAPFYFIFWLICLITSLSFYQCGEKGDYNITCICKIKRNRLVF